MCGIIAVLGRRPDSLPLSLSGSSFSSSDSLSGSLPDSVLGEQALEISAAWEELVSPMVSKKDLSSAEGLAAAVDVAKRLDGLLKGAAGVAFVIQNLEQSEKMLASMDELMDGHLDGRLDGDNGELRLFQDLIFSIKWDRLIFGQRVGRLLGGRKYSASAVWAMTCAEMALSGLDNIEVRGRDSAGIQLLLYGGGLRREGGEGDADNVRSFTYKVAAEIGKLGDNTAELRRQIQNDDALFELLAEDPEIQMTVLAHTRWASTGLISLANAHPLDSSDSLDLSGGEAADGGNLPQVSAAVNGDIDNYLELIEKYDLKVPENVTTDSKVLPMLVAHHLAHPSTEGGGTTTTTSQAFLKAVQELEGSTAAVLASPQNPGELHLSLTGSGQGLYVGLGEDMFLVVSEPYGLMAVADKYLRMEDEIVHLSAEKAGELAGIERVSLGGGARKATETELAVPEISSRDITRGEHPHFFIKEIYEAPDSVRKTLAGRLTKNKGERKKGSRYEVDIGSEAMTEPVKSLLTSGRLARIYVIGQGTAGVAAQAVAAAVKTALQDSSSGGQNQIAVEAVLASELSSAALDESRDMSDTFVIAVSQSGTTTDTNRTVELVRSRGAVVLSIVNRRSSDLVDRSDGVFYTSDGRDVEMSVASTKAFYSQAVAGLLLSFAIADVIFGSGFGSAPTPRDNAERQAVLKSLDSLPEAMEEVLKLRPQIAETAAHTAPSRRWWAVVGSGRERIAAEEVRIKLSELCYKSIAEDSIEDKKHIDLSSEPMILVCAAGLSTAVAQDMAKEVAIYRAHKAAPVVFTDKETARLFSGLDAVALPQVDSQVAFILSALAGHLFGYEAALAIDAGAAPMRETRDLIEKTLAKSQASQQSQASEQSRGKSSERGEDIFKELQPLIIPHARRFEDNLRSGEYEGHLRVSTATQLANLYRYATGTASLNSYQSDFGIVGTPAQVLDDLTLELGRAIDELYRPIDAIRHQAKTVTVGITRTDEAFLNIPLVAEVLKAGAPRDQLSYQTLKMLAGLNPVVAEVAGYIRYLIQGDDNLTILDRGGEAAQLKSRVENLPLLIGTKHRVTTEQKVLITRGRMDGRTVIIVPEVKNSVPVGLTLLHIKPQEFLAADTAAEVLEAYKGRLEILRDAVMETEPDFDETLLGEIPIMDLLDQPIAWLADKWSRGESDG